MKTCIVLKGALCVFNALFDFCWVLQRTIQAHLRRIQRLKHGVSPVIFWGHVQALGDSVEVVFYRLLKFTSIWLHLLSRRTNKLVLEHQISLNKIILIIV